MSSASRCSSMITARPFSGRLCCAGQDIDDARRVCEVLGIPHYVLDYEQRFRETVINPFAESYVAGETPIPLRGLQPDGQVRRSSGDRARAWCRCAGDRPLHPLAPRPAARPAAAARPFPPGRRRPRPELFLFATTQEQIEYLRFRSVTLPWRRRGRLPRRWAGRRQEGRQPGHLLRAAGQIQRHRFEAESRMRRSPATSSISTAGCSASMTAFFTTRSGSGAASALPRASRSMSCISMRAAAG